MNKSSKCFALLSLLSVASVMVNAVSMPEVEDFDTTTVPHKFQEDIRGGVSNIQTPRKRYYGKVSSLLNTLSSQISRELKRVEQNIKITKKQRILQVSHLHSVSRHVVRIRKHLIKAQNNYRSYSRARVHKYRDLRKLQKSLNVQAHYMRMENKYVNYMSRESKKFRHYPKEYQAIKKEIYELRRQLNIELNDLRIAYRKLHRKIMDQRNNLNRRTNIERHRIRYHRRNYNRMIGRYNYLKRQYHKVMRRLSLKLSKNKSLHSQLRSELRMLQELSKLLKNFKATDINRLENKYQNCRNSLSSLHRRVRRANCTV